MRQDERVQYIIRLTNHNLLHDYGRLYHPDFQCVCTRSGTEYVGSGDDAFCDELVPGVWLTTGSSGWDEVVGLRSGRIDRDGKANGTVFPERVQRRRNVGRDGDVPTDAVEGVKIVLAENENEHVRL